MAPDLALSRRELVEAATARLRAAFVAEPRREALRLWSDIAGGHAADALLHPAEAVDPAIAAAIRAAAERRARGEPLAYATGRCGFRRLVLRSDRRALIPRPETEGLAELLLARVRSGRVADVGTGTGALALSLADEGGYELVLGIDRSADALALAAENRAATGLGIALLRGDLCGSIRHGSLDALISNPPYLTSGEHAALDRSVREWEPREALVGGADGMEVTARLLDEGRAVLQPDGWLAVELDASRAGECARRAAALGWTDIAVHADLFGRERYLLARRSATS